MVSGRTGDGEVEDCGVLVDEVGRLAVVEDAVVSGVKELDDLTAFPVGAGAPACVVAVQVTEEDDVLVEGGDVGEEGRVDLLLGRAVVARND